MRSRISSWSGSLASSTTRAVGEEDGAVGRGCGARVVGDHEYGLLEAGRRLFQELEHLGAGLRVQVPRRLVGEDDVGSSDQGPRYRDPLLLAARELVRPVRPPLP